MDKLIRIPKSNKAEEVSLSRKIKKEAKPLLDVEERRHNYNDRRSYTSYGEITKSFENDFRYQDDDDDDNDSYMRPPPAPCSSAINIGVPKMETLGVKNANSNSVGSAADLEERLLISGGSRQRKQPILPSHHQQQRLSANKPDFPSSLCATTVRDTRSATRPTASRPAATPKGVGVVRRVEAVESIVGEETGSEAVRTDKRSVKSCKTLQESIRESLTINNTTTWNRDQLGNVTHSLMKTRNE